MIQNRTRRRTPTSPIGPPLRASTAVVADATAHLAPVHADSRRTVACPSPEADLAEHLNAFVNSDPDRHLLVQQELACQNTRAVSD